MKIKEVNGFWWKIRFLFYIMLRNYFYCKKIFSDFGYKYINNVKLLYILGNC